jgi:hypothetical protein
MNDHFFKSSAGPLMDPLFAIIPAQQILSLSNALEKNLIILELEE